MNNLDNGIKAKKGFTLAEVLLTLTIIGVVAALTIPALIQSSTNQQIVAKVKKAYSTFSQVCISFTAEDVSMDTIFAGDSQHVNVLNQFATKLNVVKNCGTGTGCGPDVMYKRLDGSDFININQSTYAKAFLADGLFIYIMDYPGSCINDSGDGPLANICGMMGVDINGFKEPNQLGKDLFLFWLTRTALIPCGSSGDFYIGDCTTTAAGFGCAAKIITDSAINY